jgi:hypothetical protein
VTIKLYLANIEILNNLVIGDVLSEKCPDASNTHFGNMVAKTFRKSVKSIKNAV